MATHADVHIRHRSGSDVALLNSMMQVIIEEELFDAEFIAQRTENYEALKERVKNDSPENTQKITGVEPEIVRKIARLYASGPNSPSSTTMDIHPPWHEQ